MGNGCSKNIRRLNKNTVAPNPVATTSSSINAIYAEPLKIHSAQNLTNNRGNSGSIPSTSNRNARLSLACPRLELCDGKTDTTRNTNLSSKFDSEAFNLASCIDTQSIIFDKSEISREKPAYLRSYSVDSSSNKSVQSVEVNKFTAHLHRLFKSNQNLTSTSTSKAPTKTENSTTFPKFYYRFSGSVQSLFSGNLISNRKRNLSASDTNLNRINRSVLSQQHLIDNDYCPSVLYNRKARKSTSEKNLDKTQTFSRLKNQLWLKFSRKKSNPSARKS